MEKTARRPSGITRRWMRNTVLLVIAIAVISAAAVSLSVAGYYRENVRTGLMAKARTSADFFSNYVTRSWAEYYDSAYRYTESFEDADRLELQFVNVQGFVETSSYGVTAGASVGTPDVAQAVETGEICSWRGRNPATGERILSVSAPMRYSDDRIIGVMRFVTSMRLVDRAALQSALVVSAVALAVVLVIILTSLYFIRSVVTPIGEITHVVRRVADGSYGARIQKQYPDEIGELVDSINEMSVKISQSEKAQTEFVSSVSHELRTPLTAITGWAETIAYDDQLNDDTRRGVGIILREARRLTKMVEDHELRRNAAHDGDEKMSGGVKILVCLGKDRTALVRVHRDNNDVAVAYDLGNAFFRCRVVGADARIVLLQHAALFVRAAGDCDLFGFAGIGADEPGKDRLCHLSSADKTDGLHAVTPFILPLPCPKPGQDLQ